MSFKKAHIYPPNPVTTRGQSIKLSSSKDKLIYTSGRTVIVRSSDYAPSYPLTIYFSISCVISRFETSAYLAYGSDISVNTNVSHSVRIRPLQSCTLAIFRTQPSHESRPQAITVHPPMLLGRVSLS